jgi:uncharacterized protein YuzE
MKISFDMEADAMYIEFRALAPGTAENRQLTDEIIANYGPDGQLAGIEILDASHVLSQMKQAHTLVFQLEPVPAFA